jgi:hypothetical protein
MELLLENISHEELKKYTKEFYNYAKKKLNLERKPKVFLKKNQFNAEDLFGKTGYYDPQNEEIHLYITDRHAKDIIRSFSHELVHHAQNLAGFDEKINLSLTGTDPAYASHDEGLREMERDAFERGNMIFRDWTDSKKLERKNIMAEEKKLPKTVVKKGHKIAKKIAKSDSAVNPYAVGMAAAKKQAGLKQEMELPELAELDNKEKADLNKDGNISSYEKKRGEAIEKSMKKQAQEQAKEDMKSRLGKDIEEQGEYVEKLEENKNEEIQHPYPQLFAEKERLLKDAFNKREEIVYQELIRRFIKK